MSSLPLDLPKSWYSHPNLWSESIRTKFVRATEHGWWAIDSFFCLYAIWSSKIIFLEIFSIWKYKIIPGNQGGFWVPLNCTLDTCRGGCKCTIKSIPWVGSFGSGMINEPSVITDGEGVAPTNSTIVWTSERDIFRLI